MNTIYTVCHISSTGLGSVCFYCPHLQTVLVSCDPREYFNTIMTASPDIQYNTKCVFMYGADESQEHIVRPVLRNEQSDAGNL